MNLISQIKEIKNKISGQIQFDTNLSKYSWFNLGGPAKVIFKPNTLNELSVFLKNVEGFKKKFIQERNGYLHGCRKYFKLDKRD